MFVAAHRLNPLKRRRSIPNMSRGWPSTARLTGSPLNAETATFSSASGCRTVRGLTIRTPRARQAAIIPR